MLRRLLVFLLAVLVLVPLAACSNSGTSNQKPVEVKVEAGDFYFKSSVTSFQQGVPYHFVVTNAGKMEHEFMIIKPMPPTSNSEELDKLAVAHIEEDDLQPGQTTTVDYTFTQAYPSGALEMACHLPGHYEAGMHLNIDVK